MSLNIYVGNYPKHFSEQDVENIFKYFEGMKLEKFVKNDKKCFSFLSCSDINELVSVVKSTNNLNVSGRNIVVRAQDHKMQDYLEILLHENRSKNYANSKSLEKSDLDKISKREPYECNEMLENESLSSVRLRKGNVRGTFGSSNQFLRDPSNVESKNDEKVYSNKDISFRNGSTSTRNNKFSERYLETSVAKEIDYSRDVYTDRKSLSTGINNASHEYHKTYVSKENKDDIESFCTDFKNLSAGVNKVSNRYHKAPVLNDKHLESVQFIDNKDLSFERKYNNSNKDIDASGHGVWVSVTNFPLGTSVSNLLNLFSDYDPIDIQVICNVPRKDKTLTEVLVCFRSQDVADDVIMNFDNTFYKGRILLVNDVEDLTILKELLVVSRN